MKNIRDVYIMKKLLKVLIISLICISLCSCAKKKELKDDIYIFFTSDVHCGVDQGVGLDGLKALVDDTKKEHEYVTLVDCGDYIQGGAIGTLSKGELVIDLMNNTGYDIVTFGNHEFDYGVERLAALRQMMEFDQVLCNVNYTGKKNNIFEDVKPYKIVQYGDYKVAFIGLLTPETTISSTPANFMEDGEFVYDFYGGENDDELAAKLQESVDAARKEGADYVVVLSHVGTEEILYTSVSLIHKTEGIDVFLDGHSHAVIVEDRYPNKNNEDVLLSSVGTKLQAVGELIIGKDGSLSTLHVDAYDRKDETMTAKMEEDFAKLDTILAEKITDLDHDLYISDEEGIRMVRARETTLGDFCADALRYYMGTDVAIVNGGGVRANVEAGELTYGDLLAVMPFQNELASCYASGQQIVDALEYCSRITEGIYKLDGNAVGENGGFLQVSGLKYTVDTSIPTSVILDGDNMFAGFAGEGRRVKDVMVLENGEYVPIDPQKTYSVAATNYVLFHKGDGNTAFEGCEAIVEEGPVDVTALIEYARSLGSFEGRYTDVEGRIIVQ